MHLFYLKISMLTGSPHAIGSESGFSLGFSPSQPSGTPQYTGEESPAHSLTGRLSVGSFPSGLLSGTGTPSFRSIHGGSNIGTPSSQHERRRIRTPGSISTPISGHGHRFFLFGYYFRNFTF